MTKPAMMIVPTGHDDNLTTGHYVMPDLIGHLITQQFKTLGNHPGVFLHIL